MPKKKDNAELVSKVIRRDRPGCLDKPEGKHRRIRGKKVRKVESSQAFDRILSMNSAWVEKEAILEEPGKKKRGDFSERQDWGRLNKNFNGPCKLL